MRSKLAWFAGLFFILTGQEAGFSAQIYQDLYNANVISDAGPVRFNTDLHFLVGEKNLKRLDDLSLQEDRKQIFIIDERVKKILEEKEKQILALGKKEAKEEKKKEIQPSRIVEVHFNFDSYKLVKTEREKLAREVDELKKEGFLRVKVLGYADVTGKTRYNLWLSRKRAEAVANFLKENGFEVVEVKGLGELDKDDVLCLNRKAVAVFEKKVEEKSAEGK